MSEPALSVAFFDLASGRHGSARTGTTLLFEGTSANVLPDGPRIERAGGGWRAELDGALSLQFDPIADPAALGPVTGHFCAVEGEVEGRPVSCLGTVGETRNAPRWDQLDALRSISAAFDSEHALLALARRPRAARGHDEELVTAWLLDEGRPIAIEEARISTVYDAGGRQRSAGLELWLPGEDLPRRCSGTAAAGSSLEMDGLDVHAAVFRWGMDGREGAGVYELWARPRSEAA